MLGRNWAGQQLHNSVTLCNPSHISLKSCHLVHMLLVMVLHLLVCQEMHVLSVSFRGGSKHK